MAVTLDVHAVAWKPFVSPICVDREVATTSNALSIPASNPSTSSDEADFRMDGDETATQPQSRRGCIGQEAMQGSRSYGLQAVTGGP
ncbi:hypothetical protein N7492_003242 [Penicillium capsulatum]|uniref:Uncharacterized protein n=1 Tax=Penicillium capsulatum TaxID=69766 RepID=A0A9W9ILI2_9EURO|nr:hypothetical protein N7492_003242 [Penicillium capsulatum]